MLEAALRAHPKTAGHVANLTEFKPTRPSYSTWFAGTWQPDGIEVLVKINVTAVERFWMTTVSEGTTGVVARVLATDDTSQNWAGSAGLDLAKEFMGTVVEPRKNVSAYDLQSLENEFLRHMRSVN